MQQNSAIWTICAKEEEEKKKKNPKIGTEIFYEQTKRKKKQKKKQEAPIENHEGCFEVTAENRPLFPCRETALDDKRARLRNTASPQPGSSVLSYSTICFYNDQYK